MIIFDQLRISDDGQRLYINLHVNFAEYFDRIMLDSITVVTADKVLETDPRVPSDDYIYKKIYREDMQVADIVIDRGILDDAYINWDDTDKRPINETKPYANTSFDKHSLSKDLFFIYVKCKGIADPCTPCRLDEAVTVGVTFDENLLYQRAMGFTKDLADDCKIPVGFTDFILLWNAFKASVETEHYVPAIKYWSMLFDKSNMKGIGITRNCGCHG